MYAIRSYYETHCSALSQRWLNSQLLASGGRTKSNQNLEEAIRDNRFREA